MRSMDRNIESYIKSSIDRNIESYIKSSMDRNIESYKKKAKIIHGWMKYDTQTKKMHIFCLYNTSNSQTSKQNLMHYLSVRYLCSVSYFVQVKK